MKDRGILFSAEMVRAILDGRKTMTRRTRGLDEINEAPDRWTLHGENSHGWHFSRRDEGWKCFENRYIKCPYGKPGDRLWVRETYTNNGWHGDGDNDDGDLAGHIYRADIDHCGQCPVYGSEGRLDVWVTPKGDWIPSIYMPKYASRITLELVSVKVERIRSISREDANAEGIPYLVQSGWNGKYEGVNIIQNHHWPEENFIRLFYSINKLPSRLCPSPWVWAIEFRRVNG